MQIHRHPIEVPANAIDANGHVNNVEFVRWMQEAAVAHADAVGCTAATLAAGATWVVRSHRIEYLKAGFLGDRIEVRTWVENFRRAFSLRKYEFVRPSDNAVLARGETDWVYVETATGRPRSIPEVMGPMFGVPPRGDASAAAQP
ncbi:MAG TPA: acyl-CoA thioesterase [Tepidisphaeraceae bacterium]|nr:acyl-CoA thioesterase [Tepidisphaeraceae bacterium]